MWRRYVSWIIVVVWCWCIWIDFSRQPHTAIRGIFIDLFLRNEMRFTAYERSKTDYTHTHTIRLIDCARGMCVCALKLRFVCERCKVEIVNYVNTITSGSSRDKTEKNERKGVDQMQTSDNRTTQLQSETVTTNSTHSIFVSHVSPKPNETEKQRRCGLLRATWYTKWKIL